MHAYVKEGLTWLPVFLNPWCWLYGLPLEILHFLLIWISTAPGSTLHLRKNQVKSDYSDEIGESRNHPGRLRARQILVHNEERERRYVVIEKRARVYQADFMHECFRSNPFLILKGNENDLVDRIVICLVCLGSDLDL